MVGLPDGGKNFEDLYNRLDILPACEVQTDKQADGQTPCHGVVRAMYTRLILILTNNSQSSSWSIA